MNAKFVRRIFFRNCLSDSVVLPAQTLNPMRNIKSLLTVIVLLGLFAAPAFAQVSLRGLYIPSPQTNPPLIIWVHDNDTIGVHIFDSTQQKVGFGKGRLSNDSFSVTTSTGQTVAGSVSGLGPDQKPVITATLDTSGSSTQFAAPRDPIFRTPGGGVNPLAGRFDGFAYDQTTPGELGVTFIIDASNNLYFIEQMRGNNGFNGGIGTVSPSTTTMSDSSDEASSDPETVNSGTFSVSTVQGFTVTGSFVNTDFLMEGTFQQPNGSYKFRAKNEAGAFHLSNISTRGFVNTGDGQLISGLIISGGPKRVLIRVLGPGLANFGVSPILETPTVQFFHNSTLLASDTGWKNNANAQEIQDTGLAPKNDGDSALLTTLEPGAYTAIITGANGATGIALVEVYEVGIF
jgi:hypothetical protein